MDDRSGGQVRNRQHRWREQPVRDRRVLEPTAAHLLDNHDRETAEEAHQSA
jgi:hypothetical protein